MSGDGPDELLVFSQQRRDLLEVSEAYGSVSAAIARDSTRLENQQLFRTRWPTSILGRI